LIGAAANGHVEVMNFLILNVASLGQYIQVACDAACKMGKMDVIKYAVEMWMCGCSPTGLDDLATFGDTSIIEYLLKHDILPPLSYLFLASDLSDEDTVSLEEGDGHYQKIFDGQMYVDAIAGFAAIKFDDSDSESDRLSSNLDADLEEEEEEEEEDDMLSDYDDDDDDDGNVDDEMATEKGGDGDDLDDDGMDEKDGDVSDLDNDDLGEGDMNDTSMKDSSGGDEEEEDYDIDDEEDSFDRYIRKKKEAVLTCLLDDSSGEGEDINSDRRSSNTMSNTLTTDLSSMTHPSQLTREQTDDTHRHTDTQLPPAHEHRLADEKRSEGNSIGISDLDGFRLRSIVGETRNFETFRQWSPATWRESIENTMDRVVCHPHRMVMIPFLAGVFSARISSAGVQRACSGGCLDVLQWIHSKQRAAEAFSDSDPAVAHGALCSSSSSCCCCSSSSSSLPSCCSSSAPFSSCCCSCCLFTPAAMEAACAGGHGEVARWLHDTVRLPAPSSAVAMTAAAKGSVQFMEWLYVTCGIALHPETCNLAISSGNCPALRWLHAFCQGKHLFTINAVDLAAINGHMDVILFLESVGIKSSAVAADGALMNGHMNVYNHLTELGAFPSQYAVRYASLPWPSFGQRLSAATHTVEEQAASPTPVCGSSSDLTVAGNDGELEELK
jgi:hypothetical protein